MLQAMSWPLAILHLDANAFFASVMQAVQPKLKGQPVVVGAERGIATAISYEAKAYGIKRGMLMAEIKKRCPGVVILPGDYELFSLFSQKMFAILRQYSPVVEEYSVDEGFIDITGLRRPLHCSYQQIAQKIQTQINQELGLPVSVGISLTKSLAKLGSGFKKPLGVTLIPGPRLEHFLNQIPLIKIWGLGPATNSYLAKFGIKTALQFAKLPESVFNKQSHLKLNKSHWEIWQELRGKTVYQINPDAKNHYQSISKTRTFRPPTSKEQVVWAELLHNTEAAFNKAREYGYYVKKIFIFLKTQEFRYLNTEVRFDQKEQYPLLFRKTIKTAFLKIFKPHLVYRATGIVLTELSQTKQEQIGLFANLPSIKNRNTQALYQVLQNNHKIDFGTSLYLPQKTFKPGFHLPMLEI